MRVATVLLITATGCGETSRDLDVSVALPFHLPATYNNCMMAPTKLARMDATMYVAGHVETPCPLTVNPDLSAVGECQSITVGAIRPLMVVYDMEVVVGQPSPRAALAYAVGKVDLRVENLPEGDAAPVIDVVLSGTDVIFEECNLDRIVIPSNNCSQRNSGDPDQWAKCTVRNTLHTSLDCDLPDPTDPMYAPCQPGLVPNMAEACGAGLACP